MCSAYVAAPASAPQPGRRRRSRAMAKPSTARADSSSNPGSSPAPRANSGPSTTIPAAYPSGGTSAPSTRTPASLSASSPIPVQMPIATSGKTTHATSSFMSRSWRVGCGGVRYRQRIMSNPASSGSNGVRADVRLPGSDSRSNGLAAEAPVRGLGVLVAGGAGYIGCVLAERLVERGYRVRILDRLWWGEEPLAGLRDRLELVAADVRDVPPEAFDGI